MKKNKVINFSKINEKLEMPNLLHIQIESYNWFLQENVSPSKRNNQGLEEVLRELFPIRNAENTVVLDYMGYEVGTPLYSMTECIDRDITYQVPLHINVRLITYDENHNIEKMIKEKVYLGDIPYITPRGTVIFNGAERTIVSQFHRSPGIFFERDEKKELYVGKIIPYFGTWLQFEISINNIIVVRPDKKKKIPVSLFLRALGISSTAEIISNFYEPKEIPVKNILKEFMNDDDDAPGKKKKKELKNNYYVYEDIIHEESGEYICEAGKIITHEIATALSDNKINTVKVVDTAHPEFNISMLNTLAVDPTKTEEEALKKLMPILRGNSKIPTEKARELVQQTYFDAHRYNLSETGRHKINQKFNQNRDNSEICLNIEDILNLIKYLYKIKFGFEGYELDDIDHLGNRRIRSIGELLRNEFRKGLARLQRGVTEKLSSYNSNPLDDITPRTLINVKPITSVIREFFGTSQLSQFLDQTNPVSELTHKRRLTALGPGGLSRDRAGFEVRDVHHTHYGRVCPIETPEGPNIGLIVSLSNYAKVNDYGYIETPYKVVKDGKVTDEIIYLDAYIEDRYLVGQANAKLDEKGRFIMPQVSVRKKGDFLQVPNEYVEYLDVSPKQLVSSTTALIPFLEHDDANRALMGSNMQRQAVPLMFPKAPLVGTGMEEIIAKDSGICQIARNKGVVTKVTSGYIEIDTQTVYSEDLVDEKTGEIIGRKGDKIIDRYELLKFRRSNQCTCINQRPIVEEGDKVKAGDILADGYAVENGSLALGSNALVAFMPWEGLNFEDAVLISERLSKDDVYTSLHIEKFEVYARDTKLGKETITRDIPNLSEDGLKNLDENGIIKIGSKVVAGDILVGKVTPKSSVDSTPEQKLLQSIFGEKARDVRDTSLKLKHGFQGIVIDVKVYSRKNKDELPAGVEKLVNVYIATKRKIKEGDKVAGRHGNKGVISRVMPVQDMPFLEDGTPVDVVLNPLGVPSRMNIGQILETHLGWAADKLGVYFKTPVFDGASESEIKDYLKQVGIPETGKVSLYDGRTGEKFEKEVTVGMVYMMKLNHLVDEKIHARSIGPYSLVTQQPLGGKAQFGGQRLGEMEVWAFEAYGAAYSLREMLTVKSDDIFERSKIYEAIVKGVEAVPTGIPESFNVLIHELEGLCLRVEVLDVDGNIIDLKKLSEQRLEQFHKILPDKIGLEDLKALDTQNSEDDEEEEYAEKV